MKIKKRIANAVDNLCITARQRLTKTENALAAKLGYEKPQRQDTVITSVDVLITYKGIYRSVYFTIKQVDDTRGPIQFQWAAGLRGSGVLPTYDMAMEAIKNRIDESIRLEEEARELEQKQNRESRP